jgi:large subunit ribosomal protein L31
MKQGIHPETYRPVVFKDVGTEKMWLVRSTVRTERKITWEDGVEYPLYTVDISSHSHPFYTGQQRFVDTEGGLRAPRLGSNPPRWMPR